MILFGLFLGIVFGCKPIVDQRDICVTFNEQYSIGMKQLFDNGCNKYECINCSEGISVINAIEQVYTQSLYYEFLTVQWNSTHFAGLTQQQIIIYEQMKQSQQIDEVFQINLPDDQNCFNLIFKNEVNILIDCYSKNTSNLTIFQLIYNKFVPVYQTNTPEPLYSQIQRISDQQLLYAQYYLNNSYLTLLQISEDSIGAQYKNYSLYQCSQFQYFKYYQNFIYLFQDSIIYQVEINQNGRCFNKSINLYSQIIAFSIYESFTNGGNCAQLIVMTKEQQYLYKLFGCANNFRQANYANYTFNIDLPLDLQMISNDHFIIIWNSQLLFILQNDLGYQVLQNTQLQEKTILLQNYQYNYIYAFDKQFSVNIISIPQLLVDGTQRFNNRNFRIQAKSQFNFDSIIDINLNLISPLNTNIYQQYKPRPDIYFDNKYIEFFLPYSGSLLSASVNQNSRNELGYFYNSTMKQILFTGFQYISLLSTPYLENYQKGSLLVGISETQIEYQYCPILIGSNCSSIHNITNQTSLLNIQLAYNLQNILISALQINFNNITCFFLNLSDNSNNSQSIIVNSTFISYNIRYDGLFILFNNNSINFYSNCNQSQVITINQDLINYKFKISQTTLFQPINITLDSQSLSSYLFINNQTNIIIILLYGQNIEPISLIQGNGIIEGVNIVQNRLILTYYVNQTTFVFEVWNIYDIFNPYLEKNLLQIKSQNFIKLFSDNLLFYVQFNQTQMYIYNPALSQHMALILNITCDFNSNISSSMLLSEQSIMSINNEVYLINPRYSVSYQLNYSFNKNEYYPYTMYNWIITSYLDNNFQLQTFNQTLMYLYNFSIIQNQTYTDIQVTSQDFLGRSLLTQVILGNTSQISQCKELTMSCQTYFQSEVVFQASVNPINKNTSSYYINYYCPYNYIFTFNESMFLQNNATLQIVKNKGNCNNSIIVDYSDLNFSSCQVSVQNGNFIYSICQNYISNYWIQFEEINLEEFQVVSNQNLNELFNANKIQIIAYSSFIQANKNGQSVFYIYNQQTNTLTSIPTTIQIYVDFQILSFKYLLNNVLVFIYITKNKIYYQIYNQNFQDYSLNLILNTKELVLDLLNQNNFQFIQIILLNQQESYFNLFLLTSGNQNYIINFKLIYDKSNSYLEQQRIQRLIPNLPNQQMIGAFYSNNYLGCIVIPNSQSSQVYFYNLTNFDNQNFQLQPILQISSLEFSGYPQKFSAIINSTGQFGIFGMLISQQYQIGFGFGYSLINLKQQFTCSNYYNKFKCSNINNHGYIIQVYKPVYYVVYTLILVLLMIFILIIFCFIWIAQKKTVYTQLHFDFDSK